MKRFAVGALAALISVATAADSLHAGSPAAGLGVPSGSAPVLPVEVDAPAVVLNGVSFSITVSDPQGAGPLDVVLETAGGTELGRGGLIPGEQLVLDGLRIEDRRDLPLRLRVTGEDPQ